MPHSSGGGSSRGGSHVTGYCFEFVDDGKSF